MPEPAGLLVVRCELAQADARFSAHGSRLRTMYESVGTTMYDATMYEIRQSGHAVP